jgi:hypothetical protein
LSHNARIFFPEFNIRLYNKNSESDYFFFPPPKSKYFFQQHWESEYFFIRKNPQSPPFKLNGGSLAEMNVREQRRANQKWTIHRNWQHGVHKTKTNKTRTQHNMCWTPLCANKHKLRKYDMSPFTNKLPFNTNKLPEGKDEPNIGFFYIVVVVRSLTTITYTRSHFHYHNKVTTCMKDTYSLDV